MVDWSNNRQIDRAVSVQFYAPNQRNDEKEMVLILISKASRRSFLLHSFVQTAIKVSSHDRKYIGPDLPIPSGSLRSKKQQ